MNFPKLVFKHERVVRPSLYVHQQAIERGDVDARRVEAALECLHECRPGTREWIEDVLTGPKVSPEQHLDELRDELAEIGVEPVDVLCPLAFGQLALRPRELEIDVRIEGVLGRCHPPRFDGSLPTPQNASAIRSRRPSWTATTSKDIRRPASSGCDWSHAVAARRSRRCFSGPTMSAA